MKEKDPELRAVDEPTEEEVWKQAEKLTQELNRELADASTKVSAGRSESGTKETVKKESGQESGPEPDIPPERKKDEFPGAESGESAKVEETSGNGKKGPDKAPRKKKKRTAASFAISFFIKIAVTALVVFLLLTFVVGLYVNHSNSAYPMLKDGDLCLTYRLATLVKGDEIAYEKNGTILFGRIVGTSGDVVDINEDSITVNGYGVYEDAVYPTTAEGAKITFPYTVPPEAVFVLNDYRSDPTDSRVYGAIPLSDTKGKVILVLRRRGI